MRDDPAAAVISFAIAVAVYVIIVVALAHNTEFYMSENRGIRLRNRKTGKIH